MANNSREDQILEATMDIIAEKTISGTGMRQIADRVGIAQSNVHYYFKSKEDLLLAVQKRVLERFVDQRKDQLEDEGNDLSSKLDVIFRQKEDILTNTPKYEYVQQDLWLRAHVNEATKANVKRNYRMWRGDVEKILEAHAGLDKAKRHMLSLLTISLLEGMMLQYLADEELDLAAYMDFCKRLILQLARDQS
ncbi:MAG: TetR/AcrR family transcriptional regulator [Bacillota bacterium]